MRYSFNFHAWLVVALKNSNVRLIKKLEDRQLEDKDANPIQEIAGPNPAFQRQLMLQMGQIPGKLFSGTATEIFSF